MVYTGFVDPNHQYLELLDNSRTLYLVLTIPGIILVVLVSAVFAAHSEEIKQEVGQEMSKLKQSEPAKFQEQLKSLEKLHSPLFILRVQLGNVLACAAGVAAFLLLGDAFLGVVIALSTLLCIYLVNKTKKIMGDIVNGLS